MMELEQNQCPEAEESDGAACQLGLCRLRIFIRLTIKDSLLTLTLPGLGQIFTLNLK